MFGSATFHGGVHPPSNKKTTANLPIENLPAPERVILPLSMHIGAPAKVIVKHGDRVKMGQIIAEAGGFVSSPVHAPVSGEVATIGFFPHPSGKQITAVEIINDMRDDHCIVEPIQKNWQEVAPQEIIQRIASAGIVGMGGASFPTHVKLSPPSDKKIDTLIINGAECEPYLTADHRLLIEKTDEVLLGALILKKALNSQTAVIGIEDNKPDAISLLNKKIAEKKYKGITVVRLKTKYPQGGEKQLIKAISRREVPSGGLPMDAGCVVQNAGTAYAVWDAIINGRPLIDRVVTVTGPTVRKPANLLVRIGTPLRNLITHCDIDLESSKKIIMGGPMMGLTIPDLDAPVIKSTSGLLAMREVFDAVKSCNCISCGNCVHACPIHLVPSMIVKYIEKGRYTDAEEWNVLDCIECGSCAYTCPARINLVHYLKLGKFHLVAAKKKNPGK